VTRVLRLGHAVEVTLREQDFDAVIGSYSCIGREDGARLVIVVGEDTGRP
jgi:hypothetical protein